MSGPAELVGRIIDTPRHYRVLTKDGLHPEISPNVGTARRLAAGLIEGGGSAVILESIEYLEDKGATLDITQPDEWL